MKFNLFNKKPAVEVKENPTGQAIMMSVRGYEKPRNLDGYYREGYEQNAIVYRCIREITTALASVEIEVNKAGAPVNNHPALAILQKPNPTQGWSSFIRAAFSEYLISGNMFIIRYPETGKAAELWVQSSKNMTVEAGAKGIPARYVYTAGSKKIPFAVDQLTGKSQVFHLKTYNPDNPFVGLPPLAHVALACDVHNNGLKWNAALLENGARPSGIMKFPQGVFLSQEQRSSLREFIKSNLQSFENAGEVAYLENGSDWIELGQSAKDMDYIVTMATMAKYIASAYGVPLPLVDNDAASYNNIEQAKERLWTDTVLPLLNEFLEQLSAWMLADYGENLQFGYNIDSIPALENLRAKRYDRMSKLTGAPLLTQNEARDAIGYEPVDNGTADSLLIPTSVIPMDALNTDEAKALEALGYGKEELKKLAADIYGK